MNPASSMPVVGLRQIMNSASRGLRRLVSQTILAACLSGLLTAQASAGGDVLRGGYATGPTYWNWRGFYAGAQANYNNGDMKFEDATSSMVNRVLRNTNILDNVSGWSLLQNSSTTGSGWGGFIGYNWQFEDAVVGVEANYNRASLERWSGDEMARQFTVRDGTVPARFYEYNINLNGNGNVRVTDFGTFRARAGWSFGSLLPYGFIGFAVGRADVTTSVTISGTSTQCDEIMGFPVCGTPQALQSSSDGVTQKGKWVYGGAIGLGFDWAMTENLFLRGEWELVQLQKIEGVDVRINTGRVALGVKF